MSIYDSSSSSSSNVPLLVRRSFWLLLVLLLLCWVPVLVEGNEKRANDDDGDSVESCFCTDMSERFRTLGNGCVLSDGRAGFWVSLLDITYCFPYKDGSEGCAAYDLWTHPLCLTNSNTSEKKIPDFCGLAWCYVDIDGCRRSSEAIHRSSLTKQYTSLKRELYYSYSVCNSSSDAFLAYETTSSLDGQTLLANVAGMWPSFHYKLATTANGTTMLANDDGMEYYNDSIPWEGSIVDYFDTIVAISNLKGVQYTYRSGTGDAVFPDSMYSASIVDVQYGISDMGLSAYWVTPERLNRTSFTVPIHVDTVSLWIPQPEGTDGSAWENALKVLKPFTASLWFVLVAIVFFLSTLYIWLVRTGKYGHESSLYRHLRGPTWDSASLLQKSIIVGQTVAESFMMFLGWVAGGSAEIDMEGTLAEKILLFGFAFFVLLVVTTYTANLTAFLTLSSVVDYLSSMQEAVTTKTPICASAGLKNGLEERWPNAVFVYGINMNQVLDHYEAGKCDAVLISPLDVHYDSQFMNRLCDNRLVETGVIAFEVNTAFAVQEDLAPGLSFWISYAANTLGITFDSFAQERQVPLICNLDLNINNDGGDDLQPMTPEHFILPIIVSVYCAVLAVILHLYSIKSTQAKTKNSNNNNNNNNNDNNNDNNNNNNNNNNDPNLREAETNPTFRPYDHDNHHHHNSNDSHEENNHDQENNHHLHQSTSRSVSHPTTTNYHPLTQNISDIKALIELLANTQQEILETTKKTQ